MRIVVAILIALVILAFGFGTLRGFARPRGGGSPAPEDVKPLPIDVRILYWCETCGTELLLLRSGTDNPPRHCGEPMTRREERPREN